jgi:hypothetical protein
VFFAFPRPYLTEQNIVVEFGEFRGDVAEMVSVRRYFSAVHSLRMCHVETE